MYALQAAVRRKLVQNRITIGAATVFSLGAIVEYSAQQQDQDDCIQAISSHNNSEKNDRSAKTYYNRDSGVDDQQMTTTTQTSVTNLTSTLAPFSQFVFSPISATNITSCALFPMPSRLVRSRTVQHMEDMSTKETLASKYKVTFDQALGEGGFGAVYIGTDRKTGELVAIKKIPKQFTNDASFQKEMNAFLHIRQGGGHPNICGLRENFDEGDHYFLVMDLISGGEMFEQLCSHGAYSEADAARLVREVASAMSFLHGMGCVHGDLKPENLMLSSQNPSDAVIKVVDFGCAQIVDKTSTFYDGQAVAALTPGYSPPEVVNGNATHKSCPVQPSIDMFSLGVIIYIMLTGVHPFDVMGDAKEEEINRNVCSKEGPPLRGTPYTKHLSPSAIDLIENLIRSDPKKRLTSMQMLEHPWVTGETAATRIIADSDKRLKKYRAFKSRLEAKVFASMVEWSEHLAENDVAKRTSLIERSFKMLDPEHHGYITTKALTKELNPENAIDASNEEDDQLSLSGFSDLLSENMKNRYFPAGHTIYREGDIGHKMYFINSGRVEISTKDGFRTISEQGNFFGEGALLNKSSTRSATIKCLTPVHALEITREYFEKYMAGGYDLQLSLREKDKNRKYDRAKAILKMQLNMEKRTIQKGEYMYQVGQEGKEIYILENGKVAVIVEDHTVFELQPGELCGEYSLTFGRPRNTSAKCLSDSCQYHVLHAVDFYKILKEHPAVQESIRDVCLRREFQKAVVFTTKKSFPTKERELHEAFDIADENRSGNLDLSDIKSMLQRMDATFTDEDIRAILESLDLDGSGAVSFEEFKRMFER